MKPAPPVMSTRRPPRPSSWRRSSVMRARPAALRRGGRRQHQLRRPRGAQAVDQRAAARAHVAAPRRVGQQIARGRRHGGLAHVGAQAQVLDGAVARRRRACGHPRACSVPARCRACPGPRSRTRTCRPSRAPRRRPASARRCGRPPRWMSGTRRGSVACRSSNSRRQEKAGPATATSSTAGSASRSARAAFSVRPWGSLPPNVSSTICGRSRTSFSRPRGSARAGSRRLGPAVEALRRLARPRSSPRRSPARSARCASRSSSVSTRLTVVAPRWARARAGRPRRRSAGRSLITISGAKSRMCSRQVSSRPSPATRTG